MLYEYKCFKCNLIKEVRHSYDDKPVVICDICKQSMEKIFSVSGIIYKGSGWTQGHEKKQRLEKSKQLAEKQKYTDFMPST